MHAEDTIVAVSSAPGRSLRGLVRITGPNTAKLLAHTTESVPPFARTLHRTAFQLTSTLSLPCLCWGAPGPRTFTGQDLAELQCPGHPALLERIVQRFITAGARLAEPGEFTFRAFLAGKIDLTQAEGIAATIAAVSDSQLRAAGHLRAGRLGDVATQLVDDLARQLALVEAGIDFTDQEDVVPITPANLHRNLTRLAAQLRDLLTHSRSWGALEALPRVVLVGRPSSGKSTLFNSLLGHPRAITSPLPGTTRDVLAEPLRLTSPTGASTEVMLIDIAGLDDPLSALDRDIQQSAQHARDAADLLIVIDDGQAPAMPPTLPAHVPQLQVRTKADLPPPAPANAIAVSALHHTGLDRLKHAIVAQLHTRDTSLAADTLALQPRHETALRQTDAALTQALHLLTPQTSDPLISHVELIAGHLRTALDELATLGGQMTPDDVIGRIFATFCIGK